VSSDPGIFLSTIILASAGLVAIIGGLLVARFVGLDTDENSNRRVLVDAAARLASARRRAADAHYNLLAWDARTFLNDSDVLGAISQGTSELEALRKLEGCPLTDEELRPFIAEVVEEFSVARRALAGYVPEPDDEWDGFRREASGLPEIRWLRVWRSVFYEITEEHAEEIERKRAEQEAARRRSRRYNPLGFNIPDLSGLQMTPPTDYGVTRARRYDELVAGDERAQQRVEDYEDELRRLREAHLEIVRPDTRLWWGVGILIAFAIVGVAWPAWIMSQGPKDLAAVRWLVYPFGGALAILLAYIVVYLAQLSRRKPPLVEIAGADAAPSEPEPQAPGQSSANAH
jgi:hypothetical protein